jgi:hypothetical protein
VSPCIELDELYAFRCFSWYAPTSNAFIVLGERIAIIAASAIRRIDLRGTKPGGRVAAPNIVTGISRLTHNGVCANTDARPTGIGTRTSIAIIAACSVGHGSAGAQASLRITAPGTAALIGSAHHPEALLDLALGRATVTCDEVPVVTGFTWIDVSISARRHRSATAHIHANR